jgi:glycosyltransferase domain-containing protein
VSTFNTEKILNINHEEGIFSVKDYVSLPDIANFTLMITHRNRIEYIERIIKSQEYPFNILIVDASSAMIQKELDQLIESNVSRFKAKVTCLYFKDATDISLCINIASNYVHTEFVSLLSDDDLVDANKLLKLVEEIETNPNIAVVIGKFIYFRTHDNKIFGKIMSVHLESMVKFSYLQDNVIDRFSAWGKQKDTMLTTYVTRRSLLADAWGCAIQARVPLNHKRTEVLASLVLLASGKIKYVDEVVNFRQMHSDNIGSFNAELFTPNTQSDERLWPNRFIQFLEWRELGIDEQFISKGEQVAAYIWEKYNIDVESKLKYIFGIKWQSYFLDTIAPRFNINNSSSKTKVFSKYAINKIVKFISSKYLKVYFSSFQKILVRFVYFTYYCIFFLRLSSVDKKSVKLLKKYLAN